jgi:hypothetical protein
VVTGIVGDVIAFTPPAGKQAYRTFRSDVYKVWLYRFNFLADTVRPAQTNFRITRASKISELRGINIYNTMAVAPSVIFQVFESCDHTVDLTGHIVSYDQDRFWHTATTLNESNLSQ